MNTFKEYFQKEELISFLTKEGYNPNHYDLDKLLKEGFWKNAALGAGLVGAGMGINSFQNQNSSLQKPEIQNKTWIAPDVDLKLAVLLHHQVLSMFYFEFLVFVKMNFDFEKN